MLNIEITILVYVIALSFLALGFILKKEAFYLSLTGSVVLMILGIVMINNPISFVSGEIITNTSTVTTITKTYSPQSEVLNSILYWINILTGMATFYISILGLKDFKDEKTEQSDV